MNKTNSTIWSRSWLAMQAKTLPWLLAACTMLVGGLTAQAQPTVPAGVITLPAGNVDALFNNSGYTIIPGFNPFQNWCSANGSVYAIPSTTTSNLLYVNTVCAGMGFTQINISSRAYLHADVYTPNGSSMAFRLVWATGSADVNYPTSSGVIVPNTWLHLDIPLSQFTGASLATVQQLGVINNDPGDTGTPNYYIDNLYFYTPTNTPLAASITSPANGATVGNYFTIAASAKVYPGSVTNVMFYDGATLLGNATSSPYSYFTGSGLVAGPHALKVVAQASTGNSATSSVVNITVTNVPPLVVYEPFNYALGALANNAPATGKGLAGNWTVGNGSIIAGLSYPSLPVTNNAIQTTGGRDVVSFASPVSSGTKYFSFLFNQAGNNGGNLNGLYLVGSGATSLIVGITAPFSPTTGSLGLGAVATTSAGATGITTFSGQQVNNFTYNQAHLIVLQIDFNTSGNNDTVSLWLDPPAGVAAPAGPANLVWSAFDVGILSGMGLNIQGGGNADKFDEIHVGNSYGEVVGNIPLPLSVAITSPTNSEVVDASFTITASAAVNPGTIANVDFYDGATFLGSANSSPYSYPATGFSAGAHALKAIAQDDSGNYATSSVVNVTVILIPPTVVSAYESFNYTTLTNGSACTATGFTGNWAIAGTANIIGDLNYPSLPTLHNAFQQAPAGQRDVVFLGTSLVKGTVYLSFLYNQTGDNGGNVNGLYLPGSGATSLYVGLTGPWSGAAGKLGLGTVTTASAGATGLASVLAEMPGPGQVMNYNQTNLIVVRIEFNTSGANDTVSLWLNPTAGVSAPAGNLNDPNPDLVVSNYDVGAITGIGFNFNGGGADQQYDELRVANTYGEVVGAPPVGYFGTGPGSVSLSDGNATVVLSGIEGNNYSVQRATDVLFTHGIKNFPIETAPAGGNVSALDDFSDLGVVPGTAFYRLQYIP